MSRLGFDCRSEELFGINEAIECATLENFKLEGIFTHFSDSDGSEEYTMLQFGRFLDIMDDENSYVEGTASMMMSVYIYRGVIEGWLDKKYLENAEKAFASVTANIDRFGILRHVCGCPDFVNEGTSCEAQASYVMAAAWREKALAL